jgi:hypothetical protein
MKIFPGILVFFLAFGWLVLLFSAIGLFYPGTVALSILASAVLSWLFLANISQNISLEKSKLLYPAILFSLAVSFATCYFATPTIFGGRDQGSIGTAAIYLSQNHNFSVDIPAARDLFQKYGAGKALNFPGFDYQKDGTLVSRFPAGYTAYLASTYNLAGLKGLQYANLIPLFLFLVAFWLILTEFFDQKISFLGSLLAASFFPFLWFAKFSLTEIYMLFLVWAGIYFLLAYRGDSISKKEIKSPKISIFISLAFFALSSLVRIEGIVFFLLAIGYVFLLDRKKIIALSKNFKKNIIISTMFLLFLYLLLNFPDLVDSGKNFIKAFLPGSGKDSAPSANLYVHLFRIFFNYNLMTYLALGLIGIIWLAVKNFKKKILEPIFLPILITFPAFFYLFAPMITLDDPWLLRRFVFAVFPTLIFYSVYTLSKFFYHKIFLYLMLILLLAGNLVVSWRFINLSENKTLLPQIEKLSQKFGSDDLILVDRMATSSPYSLMSEPLRTLYGKNAVYFFNAEDLQFVSQDRYKNIYLLAPFGEDNAWYAGLIKDKKVEVNFVDNNFIQPSEEKWALAQNVEAEDFFGIWTIK